MKNTNINLSTLTAFGKVRSEIKNDILNMAINRAIHDIGYNIRRDKIKSYMLIPGQYRLPMRIDISVCIDTPEMLLLIGDGHISFGSPWMENRRIEDIAEPTGKPKIYDNQIHFNEFVNVSIIYNLKEMQILINGEERYFSIKEKYMKSEIFSAQNITGFKIGITCSKRVNLNIQSISITEYDDKVPFIHNIDIDNKSINKDVMEAKKPTFSSCLEELSPEISSEINKTDTFLKSLSNLKFKRIVEKHGNKITYIDSNRGISYAIYLSGHLMHHSIQWYIITNSKPETWHRKDNPMEKLLNEINNKSPELADRIFYNLNECIGCRENCLAKTPYTYQAQKKLTCHGHVFFKMCLTDFQDVRDFFAELNSFSNE